MTALASNHATLISSVAAWAVSMSLTMEQLNAWPKIECNKRALDMLPEAEKDVVRKAWIARRDALTRSTRRAAA